MQAVDDNPGENITKSKASGITAVAAISELLAFGNGGMDFGEFMDMQRQWDADEAQRKFMNEGKYKNGSSRGKPTHGDKRKVKNKAEVRKANKAKRKQKHNGR